MEKVKLKGLSVCLMTFLCAIICMVFVGCDCNSEEQVAETYSVSFFDYDRSPIGVKLKEDDETLVYVQSVKKGESAVAPISPTREGYEFKGWNKDFANVTSDLDITAQYVQVCEVVFWNDNEIHDVKMVEYGKNAELPLIDPVKVGYRFDRWDGKYTNVIANTDIYAEFVKQYTVQFLGFNGVELKTQTVDENAAAIAPVPPTVDGYLFDCWDKDFSKVTGDLTVSAVYREATSCKVSFVDHDGAVLKEERVYKGTGATAPDLTDKAYIDFDSVKKQGYLFNGWDKEFSNVTADITVKAQYVSINTPILFVKPEVVKKGTVNYVTVSVYVVSGIPFSGLHIDLKYSSPLEIAEENISVKSVFVTQYSLALDTTDREVTFSCMRTSGEYSLTDNYAKVMELKFELDDFISVGQYAVEISSESYYVTTDYVLKTPKIISGYVAVEEAE